MNEFIQQYYQLIVEANKNRSISRKLSTPQMRLDWMQLGHSAPPVQDLTCASCMFRFLARLEHECKKYIELHGERNGSKPEIDGELWLVDNEDIEHDIWDDTEGDEPDLFD